MLEEISILRPKHIALQTQFGDFDQKTMLRQIELWGEKIIPADPQGSRRAGRRRLSPRRSLRCAST